MPVRSVADVVKYYSAGYHVFVGSDKKDTRNQIVSEIESAIKGHPMQVLDGDRIKDHSDFAVTMSHSCSRLLAAIDTDLLAKSESLHGALKTLELAFQSAGQQGYLIINNIDAIIEMQSTFEIEASFREVMQFFDDVAILWLGTTKTIRFIHQYERPFYLSHRIFWFGP